MAGSCFMLPFVVISEYLVLLSKYLLLLIEFPIENLSRFIYGVLSTK